MRVYSIYSSYAPYMGPRWMLTLTITFFVLEHRATRLGEAACRETKLPRDCESLCSRSSGGVGTCELRVAVLLPADTTYDISLPKVLPVLEIAESDARYRGLLPHWLQLKFLPADDRCDATYAQIAAIDSYANCVHLFLGPACDYCVANVGRVAKFLGAPLITTGGFTFDFTEHKTECSHEYFMTTRVGAMSFRDISNVFINLMDRYAWRKIQLVYDPNGQTWVAGRHTCQLMMKSMVQFLKKRSDLSFGHMDVEALTPDDYADALKEHIGTSYAGLSSSIPQMPLIKQSATVSPRGSSKQDPAVTADLYQDKSTSDRGDRIHKTENEGLDFDFPTTHGTITAAREQITSISNPDEVIPSVSNETRASGDLDSFAIIDEGYRDNTKLSAFAPPRKNATTSEKLSFLSVHPIQPSGDKHSLPFDGSRVYYRKLPTGTLIRRESFSYSRDLNKVFCTACMCFAPDDTKKEEGDRSPFIDGVTPSKKHIYEQIVKHEESHNHQAAVLALLTAKKNGNVEQRFRQKKSQEVSNRRLVLRRIIDIIIFISKQGIAYRGKSEALYALTDIDEGQNQNHGNFLNLVVLLSKYDPVLKTHISEAITESKKRRDLGKGKGRGSLVTFMSKNIINKLINICARQVKQEIVKEIQEVKSFSLNVDSCQDVGVIDQAAICVRYVKNGIPQERAVGMVPVRKSTGEAYRALVTSELTQLGLNVQDLISVSFDGAGNMAGRYSGLQAKLREEVPNLIFTHCYAHVLNLVLAGATSSCAMAKNLFGLLESTSVFIHESFKRTSVWVEKIAEMTAGRDKLRRLQNIGKTRWWAKDKALTTIMEKTRYVALIKALHAISSSTDFEPKVSFQANALMESFLKFETILTAFAFKKIFDLSTPVSQYLQTPTLDYLKAWGLIKSLEKNLRKELDLFDDVFRAASLFSSQVQELIEPENIDVEIQTTLPLRRTSKKPKQYDELCQDEAGLLSADPKRCYSITTYKVIINTALVKINEKFNCNEHLMKDAACLDPKNFHEIIKNGIPNNALNSIASIANVDRELVSKELESFSKSYNELSKTIWDEHIPPTQQHLNDSDSQSEEEDEEQEEIGENDRLDQTAKNAICLSKRRSDACRSCIPCACKLLSQYNMHISTYSNLYIAYCVILTISFTQVTCERRFSALKRIKTRLRSLLGQELLESLIILNTESDLIKDDEDSSFYERVIDNLAETSPLLKKMLIG